MKVVLTKFWLHKPRKRRGRRKTRRRRRNVNRFLTERLKTSAESVSEVSTNKYI
jgi:hypothetical protein